jgi:ribonuclease T1
MRNARIFRLLAVVVTLAAMAWLLLPGAGTQRVAPATHPSAVPTVESAALPAFLPAEATAVIGRIQRGAQHPHRQDGSVFGNREQRLPERPRGYYREYTVPTPGLSHRGARRIVTGGDPPADWYYTADHYESFRAFSPPAMEANR